MICPGSVRSCDGGDVKLDMMGWPVLSGTNHRQDLRVFMVVMRMMMMMMIMTMITMNSRLPEAKTYISSSSICPQHHLITSQALQRGHMKIQQ